MSDSDASKQWFCVIGGRKYGPIPEEEFRDWIAQGRVGPNDSVWTESMSGWAPLHTVQHLIQGGAALPPPVGQTMLKPHRGTVVLVLGILGLAVCWICGAFAWSMGNRDLQEIDTGAMDPSGRGLTQAGRICGMISVILGIISCGLSLIYLVVMFVIVAAEH